MMGAIAPQSDSSNGDIVPCDDGRMKGEETVVVVVVGYWLSRQFARGIERETIRSSFFAT